MHVQAVESAYVGVFNRVYLGPAYDLTPSSASTTDLYQLYWARRSVDLIQDGFFSLLTLGGT